MEKEITWSTLQAERLKRRERIKHQNDRFEEIANTFQGQLDYFVKGFYKDGIGQDLKRIGDFLLKIDYRLDRLERHESNMYKAQFQGITNELIKINNRLEKLEK